jgi:hypothetical protein
MRKVLMMLLAALLLAGMAGCVSKDDNSTSPLPTDPENPDPGDPVLPSVYRIGHLDGAGGFQEGVVQVDSLTLSSGGTTTVAVNILDSNGLPPADGFNVNFTSDCALRGEATLESPVALNNGRAETQFVARGCRGEDTVTAWVTGSALMASRTLTVAPAEAGSIKFVTSSPDIIALRGIGGEEVARVTFEVKDRFGSPARDIDVSFTLNHASGDAELLEGAATSDGQGLVHAWVTSGTVVAPLVVTATILDSGISTQSSELKVSSGTPDQDSFSISVGTFNSESWLVDGVEVEITARLADHFNNRVPDGTVVTFWAEGGSIDDANHRCVTVNGACTVKWISQNPRPANGRVTILAYAVGDETFYDTNANGRFDAGESFMDLGKPFRNDDETFDAFGNHTWSPSNPFVDTNESGLYEGPNGKYDGILCNDRENNAQCGNRSTHIFKNVVLIMADSWVDRERMNPSHHSTHPIDLTNGRQVYVVQIVGEHGQIMPAGTEIKVTLSHGELVGPNPRTVLNAVPQLGSEIYYEFEIKPGDQPGDGDLLVEVTTPGGATTWWTVPVIQE